MYPVNAMCLLKLNKCMIHIYNVYLINNVKI